MPYRRHAAGGTWTPRYTTVSTRRGLRARQLAEAQGSPAAGRAHEPPPVRLRYLLALGVLGFLGLQVCGWMQAAWQLRDAATNLADYAACMAGPTGPTAWQSDREAFLKLLRRRIVASSPDERLFEPCVKPLQRLTQLPAVIAAHGGRAWDFVEYGGRASDLALPVGSQADTEVPRLLSVASLGWGTNPLEELAEAAGPFGGDALAPLKASSTAHEAPHPVAPPEAGVGRGLPGWRARYENVVARGGEHFTLSFGSSVNRVALETRDGGINWRPTAGEGLPARSAEACVTQGSQRAFRFQYSQDGSNLQVASLLGDDDYALVTLGTSDTEVLSAACDEQALVAAVSVGETPRAGLVLCPYARSCRPLSLGAYDGIETSLPRSVDVARLHRATIVAVSAHGIVRVTSSRDEGRSWTPFVVAFDAGESVDASDDLAVPQRLLELGDRLLLHGATPRLGQPYALLVSDNLGASWHTPLGNVGQPALALRASSD